MNVKANQSFQKDVSVSNFTRGLMTVAWSVFSSCGVVAASRGSWLGLGWLLIGLFYVYHYASGRPALSEYRVFMSETKVQVMGWIMLGGSSAVLVYFFSNSLL